MMIQSVLFAILFATTDAIRLRGGANQQRALDENTILDLEARVKETYRQKGLWKEGDSFKIDYYNLKAQVKNMKILNHDPRDGEPTVLNEVNQNNDSDTPMPMTLEGSRKVTRSVSVAVTAGIKMGMSMKASVGIEGIIDIGSERSLEFELSSTTTISAEEEQSLKWVFQPTVAPRSRLEATMLLQNIHVSPKFTADVDIQVTPYPGGHGLAVAINRNRYSTTLAEALRVDEGGRFRRGSNDNQVLYQVEGQFTGVGGTRITADYKQFDLRKDGMDDSSTPTKSGVLENLVEN